MSKKDFKPHLVTILKKMCEVVGADYDKVDFDNPKWYFTHVWTKEQEKEFTDWLIDHLYNNKEIRQQLMRWSRKNKRLIKIVVKEFVFNYGWKDETK